MTQRDRAWLSQASQKDIAAATAAGELQTVLAGGNPPSAAIQEELDRIVEIHPPAPFAGQGANADSASPDGMTWREAERAKLRAQCRVPSSRRIRRVGDFERSSEVSGKERMTSVYNARGDMIHPDPGVLPPDVVALVEELHAARARLRRGE